MSKKALKRALSEDTAVLKLIEAVEHHRSTFDFQKVSREAKELHNSRSSRKLYSIALQPTPVYKAVAEDLRARSRLAELQAQVYTIRASLSRAVEKTTAYIQSYYAEEIADIPSANTVVGRKQLLHAILKDPIEFEQELQDTEKLLDLYITDIDKAGYGLTNVTNILQRMLHKNANH